MSRVPRTNPAPRTGPEVAPAGASTTPISGEVELAIRVMIALGLGLLIGAEREFRGHPAGLRTMALISAGAGGTGARRIHSLTNFPSDRPQSCDRYRLDFRPATPAGTDTFHHRRPPHSPFRRQVAARRR